MNAVAKSASDDSSGVQSSTGTAGSADVSNDGKSDPVVVPRIQAGWQEKFVKRSTELNATEAWGVFSEGGWVDDGQLMVFVTPDGRATIEFVPPGAKTVGNRAEIGAADVEMLRGKLGKLDGLEDHVTAAYDAVGYELVHLISLADTGLAVKTRIMMVMPTEEKSPDHFAVLAAMKDLRRSRVLK